MFLGVFIYNRFSNEELILVIEFKDYFSYKLGNERKKQSQRI